jgi:hypothetical protein
LIADHAVVSNQTNSQPNVIAAVDNLIKGVTNGVSNKLQIQSPTNILPIFVPLFIEAYVALLETP